MIWRKEEKEIILFKVLSIFLNSKSRLWLCSECNIKTISYSHLNQQQNFNISIKTIHFFLFVLITFITFHHQIGGFFEKVGNKTA